jgi:hypothetical protein
VSQTLLAGGADPEHGSPSALEAMVLFKQDDKWRAKFEAAPGRGTKASAPMVNGHGPHAQTGRGSNDEIE